MIDYELNFEEERDLMEEARLARLAAFAGKLVQKRKEAIDGRKKSGIEAIWEEDDDYYDGIDDTNRSETMLKPATSDGRITRGDNHRSTKSTVFVNITQPYCDMASSRVSDMLLPTDDKPFSFDPTPVPDVKDSVNNQEMMPGGQHTVGQAAEAFIAEMKKKSDLAETQVWDWISESRWHSEMRKVIEQAARIGTGCIKGPFPVKRKIRIMNKLDGGDIELKLIDEIKPASKRIDVWNLYPDPACGESIHNGSYIWERDFISARQLQDLKGTGYLDSEIDAVLKEGPNKRNVDGKNNVIDTDNFEIWYFVGIADSDDLQSSGCECDDDKQIPVVVTMVNDRVIKASVSVLESGEFPYDVMVWQRTAGSWVGVGVSRQIRTSQRMVIAATRNMMDNAGASAGPQIVLKNGSIVPANGTVEITPLKIWYVDENADIADVKNAITSIVIPTLQVELGNIIKMALDFAERATSMPLIMQGQQGANTHTVGGMNILQNNSSTVLRRISRIADDDIFEPHFTRYYEWLMLYGKPEMKGDYKVVVHGSSALYERDAQNQMIMQLLPLSANKEFGLNPESLMKEVIKINKMNPARVLFTDEEKQAQQKAAQENPPVDPRIAGAREVAQIKVQGDMQKAQLVQQSDMQEIQAKSEAMRSEMALKIQMAEQDRHHQLELKKLDYQMKIMELAQSQQISVDSIKAALASDAMKIRTQKELSLLNNSVKQAAIPPTEPIGRANNGHAYEQ